MPRKILLIGQIFVLVALSLVLTTNIYGADPSQNTSEGTIQNPLLDPSLQGDPAEAPSAVERAINTLLNLLLVAGALAFFFMLLISGIKWILAGGDKEKLQNARGQLTSALVGLLIIFSVFGISRLISSLFGINLLQFSIPRL